jgi:hypothetical protein
MKIYQLGFSREPYKYELLSSWLTRLAHANFLNLSSFLGAFFPYKQYPTKDLDIYLFDDLFYETLSQITKIDKLVIKSLQLNKYESYIEEDINKCGRHNWFTPLHPGLHKDKFFGIRFCPHCLDEKPYFREHWRFLFMNTCKKHKCYLLNRCPNCLNSLDYTLTNYKSDITFCYKCGFDLRTSKTTKAYKINDSLFYQSLLYKIAMQGFYYFQNQPYYSAKLFFLLRIFARNILKTSKLKKRYIEQLSPKILNKIVIQSVQLLENYPHDLRYFCKKTRLTNEAVFLDKARNKRGKLPNWFLI